MKIYLDFNSTHPPDAAALKSARDFYFEHYANSSGLSLESQVVNKRIEGAREDIAKLFAIDAKQIVFTSCATESNNLLIREFHRRASMPGGQSTRAQRNDTKFRVLSSPFEHPSVSECLKILPDTEVTFLKTDKSGGINPGDFATVPWTTFDLIVMMSVQNESGVVLPLSELVAALPAEHPPVLADFSQALPKLAEDAIAALRPGFIAELTRHNFFLTATGHKVGAGFGAGLIITPMLRDVTGDGGQDALSVPSPQRASLSRNTALLAGGNQEHGLRAGSHNVEAIIALGEALKNKIQANSHEKWRIVSVTLENLLREKISPIHPLSIIGTEALRAPGTTLLLLPGVAIDFLIMALDQEGITVSTGTSCKSRSRSPSAALMAMGFSEAEALSVVRLSYSQDLPGAQIAAVAAAFAAILQRLTW